MPRPKGSKNKINEGEIADSFSNEEEISSIPMAAIEEPASVPFENQELKELKEIHSLMTAKGIRDIGQLEVLISKLQ